MSHELLKLYNNINNSYSQKNYNILKYSSSNLTVKLHNNNFANVNLSNLINQYQITINNNTNLYIITNKLDHILIDKIVNRIIAFKKFSKNSKKINIYIWLSNDKKILPKKSIILSAKHINSGSSYVLDLNNPKNGDIHIWRKEEILKVLLHELLHSLRYDYHALDHNLDSIINKKYNVNSHINVNESYTETLATILNCMYCSIEYNRDYEYFLALLNNEQNHSLHQVNKILKHQNYYHHNQLLRKYSDKKFMQNTSVFSYYILKAMALNNITLFIKFASKNNLKYPKNGHLLYTRILNENVLYNDDKKLNYNNRLNMTIT